MDIVRGFLQRQLGGTGNLKGTRKEGSRVISGCPTQDWHGCPAESVMGHWVNRTMHCKQKRPRNIELLGFQPSHLDGFHSGQEQLFAAKGFWILIASAMAIQSR